MGERPEPARDGTRALGAKSRAVHGAVDAAETR